MLAAYAPEEATKALMMMMMMWSDCHHSDINLVFSIAVFTPDISIDCIRVLKKVTV